MKSERSNFACIAITPYIYVFGGIAGNEQGSYKPKMASPNCERYNTLTDTWYDININGAPTLAAFGWC